MSGVVLRSVLACAAFAASAATAVHPSTTTATTWDAAIDAPASVAYLKTTYGISTAEAKRRLVLQRDAAAIARDLATRMPDTYAGMWLDQRRGGILTVASTTPAAVSAAVST